MRLSVWILGHQVLTIEVVRHDSQQMLAETIAGFIDEPSALAGPRPDDDEPELPLIWPPRVADGGRAIYAGEMFTFECSDDASELPLPPNDA